MPSASCRGNHPPTGPQTPLRRLLPLALAAGACCTCLVTPALAQTNEQRRIERMLRNPEQDWRLQIDRNLSVAERTLFEYGGFFSFTGLWLDDASNNNRRLLQFDTTLFARASLDGVHTGFVRLRFPYQEFSEGDSFNGKGDQWKEPFLDRYTYEFDLRRHIAAYEGRTVDYNFNLSVGRQFVDWGAGLALSEVLLSIRPTITFNPRWAAEGLIGVTPDNAVDFDASRADFDRRTRKGYFGAKLVYTTERGDEYYLYGLRMQDYHTNNLVRSPLPGITTAFFDYNATYVGIGTNGTLGADWVYLGELVWESGETTSDPVRTVQTRDDITAFAGRAQFSYLFRDQNQSRAQVEGLFATGDDDRNSSTDTVNGNLANTDDNAFNSLGFANTGLAFGPSLSNLWTLRGGISTFPLKDNEWFDQLQVGADVLVFNKFDPDGGFDEPTDGNMFLGGEIDLFANWRITSDFALNLRYGAFFPGAAIIGSRDTRHFVLMGFTFSF